MREAIAPLVWHRPSRKQQAERFLTLLWALVSRDVRGRYRRSILGPAWAIIQPLFLMVVFTFIRGIVNIPSEGVPYVIFSYSALVPWTFFSSAVSNCGPSIMGNAGILKKMAVPREVFPLAAVLTAAFDLLMSGLVLAGMMLWFRVPVGWLLLWVPVLVLMTGTLALGVGMFLAAFGTFKRDFLMAGGFLMQLWLYVSPIIYPVSSVPERWRGLYVVNPIVGILEGFRAVLIKGAAPDLGLLAWSLLGIVVAWAVAWPLFRYMSQYFADVL
jgi:lipopolysaccharide transport system permease protein